MPATCHAYLLACGSWDQHAALAAIRRPLLQSCSHHRHQVYARFWAHCLCQPGWSQHLLGWRVLSQSILTSGNFCGHRCHDTAIAVIIRPSPPSSSYRCHHTAIAAIIRPSPPSSSHRCHHAAIAVITRSSLPSHNHRQQPVAIAAIILRALL
jgi:hypothetical protein